MSKEIDHWHREAAFHNSVRLQAQNSFPQGRKAGHSVLAEDLDFSLRECRPQDELIKWQEEPKNVQPVEKQKVLQDCRQKIRVIGLSSSPSPSQSHPWLLLLQAPFQPEEWRELFPPAA